MFENIREIYYHMKATYFLERNKLKPTTVLPTQVTDAPSPANVINEVDCTEYAKYNQTTKQLEWVTHPKYATIFGFWYGAAVVVALKKKYKGTDYHFSLVTTADTAFIHEVTTGEKLKMVV